MGIVGGFDVHRSQITFDWVDPDTGESARGRVTPATRSQLRCWLERFEGREALFALEGMTGWRFVVEELHRAGFAAVVADPAEVAALRGPKRRAKTDKADARLMRELAQAGRLTASWIPPAHILEARSKLRLYKSLTDQRRGWMQRIHATLFHQGVPPVGRLSSRAGRAALAAAELSPAGRDAVEVALRMIQALDREITPLAKELTRFAAHQHGCRALMSYYGIGAILAVAILVEMGDTRRFRRSRQAVRHAGLDITVYASDTKRAPGHLSRQGPELLRWALFEAALSACKTGSPDHHLYLELKAREGHGRACLSIARLIAKRVHHTLRELGDLAFAPAMHQEAA